MTPTRVSRWNVLVEQVASAKYGVTTIASLQRHSKVTTATQLWIAVSVSKQIC